VRFLPDLKLSRPSSATQNLLSRFFVDHRTRAYGNDLRAVFDRTIDNTVPSYSQPPISFQFPFKRLPAGRIYEDVSESGAHLAFENRMELPQEVPNISRNLESLRRHVKELLGK
jgi:hypothetical protein